jgi:outer membrane protein TolC
MLRLKALGPIVLAAFAPALGVSGCAMFTEDGGMAMVQNIAGDALRKEVRAERSDEHAAYSRGRVAQLLRRSISADAAVQIALLNNRELQAVYNGLGVAEARRVRASLPPNPVITLGRVSGAGGFEIERQVALNLLALATLPARAEVASARFQQVQLQASAETLRIGTETRRAWTQAVAAQAIASFLGQAQTTASAATDLAKRLGETGAINKLDQARNQVFAAEVAAQLATARQRALSARERLIRLMGLWGEDLSFKLPASLPALPSRPRVLSSIEAEAVARRVDLQIARIELEALAKSYGLAGATRFVSLLELSGISHRKREPGEDNAFSQRGGEIEFQIPLFDFGESNVREAEHQYMQAVNRLAAKAVNVRSEAREAYQRYRTTYDIARHYEREVLPLRKIISDETLLRYNAMQIDVFGLLAEARARISSITASIEAARDFRLAEADMFTAVIGGGAGVASEMETPSAAAAQPAADH